MRQTSMRLRLDRSSQVEDERATKRQRLPGAQVQAAIPVFSSPPGAAAAAAAKPTEVVSAVPRGLVAATLAAVSSPALPPIPPIPQPRASLALSIPAFSDSPDQENLAGHQILGHQIPLPSPSPPREPHADAPGDAGALSLSEASLSETLQGALDETAPEEVAPAEVAEEGEPTSSTLSPEL